MAESNSDTAEPIKITPEMVSEGVSALRGLCPFDVAFPHGGEDAAVEAVLRAGLAALFHPTWDSESTEESPRDDDARR